MYRYLDKLLEAEKKKIRSAFNRVSVMGFDELNVINTRKTTASMYDKFLEENEALYLKAAKDAYRKAVKAAKAEGYEGEEEEINGAFVVGLLAGYNLVTGYLYGKEADRKRLRLNEQIYTAREYGNRNMFQDSLRRAANLWWTQTTQYGISAVDEATVKGFTDMGVERVQWIAADDEKTCPTCGARDNKIYKIQDLPPKPHYGCRCYIVPVKTKE
ncbi:MAG: minor capsid protein [Bacteroidales bacterium]|nr:minor capsid protein [Bacteroidales bacterium]